jgi:hypothetical protein
VSITSAEALPLEADGRLLGMTTKLSIEVAGATYRLLL